MAMANDNRDRSFDQALARRLRSGGHFDEPDAKDTAVPAEQNLQAAKCLDAGILAAYHERTLAPEEMDVAKEHITGCLRCQEVLVQLQATDNIPITADKPEQVLAMQESASLASENSGEDYDRKISLPTMARPRERTDSEKTVQIAPLGRPARTSRFRWVAPVGALAAGLLVFIAVREVEKPSSPRQIQVATNQRAPTNQEAQASQSTAREPASTYSAKNEPSFKEEQQSLEKSTSPSASGLDSLVLSDQLPRDTMKRPDSEVATRTGSLSKSKSAGKPARSGPDSSFGNAANAGSNPTETKPLQRGLHLQRALPPAEQNRADVAAASAESDSAFSAPDASTKPQAPAVATASGVGVLNEQSGVRTQSRSLSAMRMAKALEPHLILSLGGNITWRVGLDGFIEQSRDGGRTWLPQSSGVKEELLAGSAPSVESCWIVGKGGTILRTTDGGAHWAKVVAPVASDFVSIHAMDAMHATVREMSHGWTYATSDGGLSWTLVPNH